MHPPGGEHGVGTFGEAFELPIACRFECLYMKVEAWASERLILVIGFVGGVERTKNLVLLVVEHVLSLWPSCSHSHTQTCKSVRRLDLISYLRSQDGFCIRYGFCRFHHEFVQRLDFDSVLAGFVEGHGVGWGLQTCTVESELQDSKFTYGGPNFLAVNSR